MYLTRNVGYTLNNGTFVSGWLTANYVNWPLTNNSTYTVWGNSTISLTLEADFEMARFVYATAATAVLAKDKLATGQFIELDVRVVVGGGYANNYFWVKRLH